jgi:hypothetical protein
MDEMKECPICGSPEVKEEMLEEVVPYSVDGPNGVEHHQVLVVVPTGSCFCGFMWTDKRAEKIRDEAVRERRQKKV